jgi:hypothetical protein
MSTYCYSKLKNSKCVSYKKKFACFVVSRPNLTTKRCIFRYCTILINHIISDYIPSITLEVNEALNTTLTIKPNYKRENSTIIIVKNILTRTIQKYVLLRRHFVTGDVLLRRRSVRRCFIWRRFDEMFCMCAERYLCWIRKTKKGKGAIFY